MSIGNLVGSASKALTSRLNRSYRRTRFLNEGILLKLEHNLYYTIIVPLIAFLPAPLAYGVARLRGGWRYRLETSRSQRMLCDLETILGDQLSPIERVRTVRDFFRIRSCEAVDVIRLSGKGRALAQFVEIHGLEHVEAALAAGKGAFLCGAHFGSFNSCFSLIGARGFPITVLGRWSSTMHRTRPTIEQFFWRLFVHKPLSHHRRRPNIEPGTGQFGVAVQAAAILRRNELIGASLDPPVLPTDRERAVQINFLNGKALLLPGIITIARLMETPVLMTFLRRSADMRHQVLEISAPVPLDGDAVAAFGRCIAVIETAIRQNPAHWMYWGSSALVELGLLADEAMKMPV